MNEHTFAPGVRVKIKEAAGEGQEVVLYGDGQLGTIVYAIPRLSADIWMVRLDDDTGGPRTYAERYLTKATAE